MPDTEQKFPCNWDAWKAWAIDRLIWLYRKKTLKDNVRVGFEWSPSSGTSENIKEWLKENFLEYGECPDTPDEEPDDMIDEALS